MTGWSCWRLLCRCVRCYRALTDPRRHRWTCRRMNLYVLQLRTHTRLPFCSDIAFVEAKQRGAMPYADARRRAVEKPGRSAAHHCCKGGCKTTNCIVAVHFMLVLIVWGCFGLASARELSQDGLYRVHSPAVRDQMYVEERVQYIRPVDCNVSTLAERFSDCSRTDPVYAFALNQSRRRIRDLHFGQDAGKR